LREATRAIT